MIRRISFSFLTIIFISIIFVGCVPEEPPTKSSMEGVWEVVAVYDADSNDVTSKVNFPITAFHLSSDNTVISTAGPLTMLIVYGDNKYTNITSKIDQVFNYASLDLSGGEFFLGGGVQERFTLEMKLEGAPGQKSITELLDLLGIGQDYLDVVVYHKFMDVKVWFDDGESGHEYDERNTMYWQIDDKTFAEYSTKDNYGNKVAWAGISNSGFQKVSIVLEKRLKDIKDLVKEAS